MNPRAFFSFKNNANISRTLAKNHFKPKVKTGIEKRKDEVIRAFDQYQENVNTIQRLGAELEQLKVVNVGLYRINKKELNRVIAGQKQGLSAPRVRELLNELPDSYLPDE